MPALLSRSEKASFSVWTVTFTTFLTCKHGALQKQGVKMLAWKRKASRQSVQKGMNTLGHFYGNNLKMPCLVGTQSQ